MTLLITVFAAVISTAVWYMTSPNKMRLGTLCLIYWGASLMWTVDAVTEFIEEGAEYFTPKAADMLNDAFLGLTVVALGLVIWTVTVLVNDPKGVVRNALTKKAK